MTVRLPKALIGTPISAPAYDPWKCGDCGRQRVPQRTPPHELSSFRTKECSCGDIRFATAEETQLAREALAVAIARHLI